jgi:hypothetical protein
MFRLFSHGYNFFSPGEAVVYHLYSRAYRTTFQSTMSQLQLEQKKTSLQVVKSLLLSSSLQKADKNDKKMFLYDLNLTCYGFGKVRDINELFHDIGCDLGCLTVSEKDWVEYMIPRGYGSKSLSFVEGLIISDDSALKSFKNDIISSVVNSVGTGSLSMNQNVSISSSSDPLTSILQFLK